MKMIFFSLLFCDLFLCAHSVLVQHTQLLEQEDHRQSVVSLLLSGCIETRRHSYKSCIWIFSFFFLKEKQPMASATCTGFPISWSSLSRGRSWMCLHSWIALI